MTTRLKVLFAMLLTVVLASGLLFAQSNSPSSDRTPVSLDTALPFMVAISATAAINNQVTLTVPAPPAGQYNYICKLWFNASQDATATAIDNAVTTSTNFNSFAFKFSAEDVAQKESWKGVDFG